MIRIIDRSTHEIYAGWFELSWPQTEDYYSKAMKLTGAKYADGRIRVPPEQFVEVEDFAEHNGFMLTPEAQAIADKAWSNFQYSTQQNTNVLAKEYGPESFFERWKSYSRFLTNSPRRSYVNHD